MRPRPARRMPGSTSWAHAHEPEDVRLELGPQVVEGDRLHRPALAVAGVVHERAHRRPPPPPPPRTAAAIEASSVTSSARVRQPLVAQVRDRLEPAGRGVHGVSVARQQLGRGPPDARGAAGDEHGSRRVRHGPLRSLQGQDAQDMTGGPPALSGRGPRASVRPGRAARARPRARCRRGPRRAAPGRSRRPRPPTRPPGRRLRCTLRSVLMNR